MKDRRPVENIEDQELAFLLEAIYWKFGYDFRSYSVASIRRRLAAAQENFGCRSLSALQDRILHEEGFFNGMLKYLTVQVSEMFRDPQCFRAIRQHVVPHLRTYPSLKVWIAGCSTGEEVLSLAILFREEGLESRTLFYATDINEDSLRIAESGVYDLDRIAGFSKNYLAAGGKGSLSDYYATGYGAAVFDRSLRERVVYSDHSLATDSTFTEAHLVSCRNVLIYFKKTLQDRALGLFRDSLVRRGFLALGAKESLHLASCASDFALFDREGRLYQKVV